MGQGVDTASSLPWLQYKDLFEETEGFVCIIIDKVIKTQNYQWHIMKDGTINICLVFHLAGDSLRFIVSGCSNLANIEYLHIHKN